MKGRFSCRLALFAGAVFLAVITAAAQTSLPNLDRRPAAGRVEQGSSEKLAAAERLRGMVPGLRVEFEPLSGAPKIVSTTEGFLTGPLGNGRTISPASLNGFPANDPHRVTKAFVREHSKLFGHGAEALDQARIVRDDLTAHNGMRTVVWEQQVGGISVFEGIFISHTTRRGELIKVSSQFLADQNQSAVRGTPDWKIFAVTPPVEVRDAVALAAKNVGVKIAVEDVVATSGTTTNADHRQKFRAPGLKGETDAKLIWLPVDKDSMRLCWDVILMSREKDEMFRILIDVRTGEVMLRRCLTSYISDASYRVYTSDSPSPFSPGWPTPNTNQPSYVSRTLVTLPALDTNASPQGWIPDGGNQTLGNNVDAHTDRNNDNLPDLPRPQGSPSRVFDFPMDLTTQDPTNYASAAVVQLFYLCNWYHDKLYALGFTESAGNFQSNNFALGGAGNDAVQADALDGSGLNNANFSTPPDGSSGRMQMYIFSGPSPRRDGDLDAEIVFHEHTHGLSWRLVGGGQALGDTQSDGMGEGWSDFYGLTLLSEPGDDVNGNYAAGGYATYQFSGLQQNYYYGIRRYPYSTDMTKNPLTFKDIDPAQASTHAGIPRSPIIGSTANEVHNEGEVWCVTLWEARVKLINKYGWTNGNQLTLQLVTDGMKLTAPHPNFLQARDAIIQADLVDTGGANRANLWAAFAKRGMGYSATSPASSTTTGLHEAFDVPDDLRITPATGFVSSGGAGGPFSVTSQNNSLTNTGLASFNWTLSNTSLWINASPTSGTLVPGGAATTVTFSLNTIASNLVAGTYNATLRFTNLSSGVGQGLGFTLTVLGAPVVTAQPTNQTVFAGSTATFAATVIGVQPLYYQWRLAGTNLPSATNLILSLPGVAANQAGNYSLVVSNSLGVTVSSNALLTVLLPAANDVCSSAIVISTGNYTNSQTTTNATSTGDPVPTCVGGFGKGVWYIYTPPANGSLVVDTFGSSFDTGLGVYTGSCGALTQINCNDDTGGTLQSIVSNSVTGGTTYYILAGGWSGASGALVLHVNFVSNAPNPPNIVAQPPNQTTPVGGTASFTVGATGTAPLGYFWRRDGAFIVGATNATYSTNNVQFTDSGAQFSCLVSNSYGSVLSSNATLTVVPNTTLSGGVAYVRSTNGLPWGRSDNEVILTNVFGTNWLDLRYQTVVAGSLFSTSNRFIFMEGGDNNALAMAAFLTNNLPAISNWVSAGGSLFLNAAPNQGGSFYLGFGVTLVFPGFSSNNVAANPGHQIFNGPYLPVSTNFTGNLFGHATVSGTGLTALLTSASNGNYVLAEKSYASGHLLYGGMTLPAFHSPLLQSSNLLANILVYAAAQSASGSTVFNFESGLQGFVIDNTFGSGSGLWHLSTGRGFDAGHSSSNSLYYGHNETVAGGGNYDTSTSNGGAVVSPAFALSSMVPLSLSFNYLMAVESLTNYDQAFVEITTNNGASYLAIASKNYFGGLTNATGGVWVSNQVDLSAFAGATVRLRFHFDTIDSIANSTEGWYLDDIAISGSVISAPAITAQPTNQIVSVGGSAIFSVTATGGSPLYYFWRRNGIYISGATSSTYSTNNVQLSDSGSLFSCVVSNAYGLATSSNATLTVVGTPPTITNQPVSQFIPSGGAVTFSVGASGSAPLNYQWLHNGTNIPGATASSYSIGSVTPEWGGAFSAVVTNALGAAASLPATLTVLMASATNDFILNGNYVSLPLATNGQFLSLRFAQGGRFNPAGTGGTNGVDFWYPGTPVYNYVVGLNTNKFVNGAFATLTVSNLSASNLLHALISGTSTNSVTFTRDVSFGVTDTVVTVIDTIKNNGPNAISNVVTLDSTDPNQGQNGGPGATFVTYNDVVSIVSTNDAVVAVGTNDNLSLLLGSESGTQIPSAFGFNNIDVYGSLTVVDPNGTADDINISLAHNYGTLNAGQSRAVTWNMVFGNSYGEVTNAYAISATRLVLAQVLSGTNGQVQFNISGRPGAVILVQASTNLLDWQTISTLTNASGTLPFLDPAATNYGVRFYRCIMP